MELLRVRTGNHQVVVSPIGDLQWSGKTGPTAKDHAKRHIDRMMNINAWFFGLGDYIDFLSPSNRQRLQSAALYDTAEAVIEEKVHELVQEVFDEILKPTKGRWLGLLEGHHFAEFGGTTSDILLSELLDAPFLGTSAYVRLEPAGV